MSLFKNATNETAYLKAALFGFQGSGKTYTACEIAIGLYQYAKLDKPVFFIDTETGSDWAIPCFKEKNIEVLVAKTRSFEDLLTAFKEAEKGGSILLIDSVTHFWNEMMEAYKRQNNIGARMAFHHWSILKPEWNRFSNLFVNSSLHVICCGRAGWEWGDRVDEEGYTELAKLGTKMKAESEFGFEPSLVIEMKRIKGSQVGDKIDHGCYVVKDRNMSAKESLDGKFFTNPTFKDFLPHIKLLNLGQTHVGFDESKTSDKLFEKEGESFYETKKRKNIAYEELEGLLQIHYPSTSKEEKKAKAALKKKFLGTYSETQIEELPVETIKYALLKISDILTDKNRDEIIKKIIDDLVATNGDNENDIKM